MRSEFAIELGEQFGIIGSPPCQGFSNIGERMWNDPRNDLGDRFFDVVLNTEPLFFVFENVPALRSFGARPAFNVFLLRQNKVTGRAASAIIDGLPMPNGPRVRRTSQTKKRLISRAVEESKHTIRSSLATEDFDFDLCEAARAGAMKLRELILSGLSGVYIGEALPEAQAAVSMQETAMAVVAMSVVCEMLLQQKRIEKRDCICHVKRIAECSEQHKVLSIAAEGIIRQYESLPELTEHRDVPMGPTLGRLVDQASEKYDVNRPIVLDAADFGAPQRRQRLFLIGVHKDLLQIENSGRFWDDWAGHLNGHVASMRTAGDALGDMLDIGNWEELGDSDMLDARQLSDQPSELASRLRLMEVDCVDLSFPRRNWNPYWLDGCKRTVHHESVLERLKGIGEGEQDKISRRSRLHRDRPSPTLRAGTLQDKGSHTAVRPIHFEHNRVITVREGARLMGYPDWMTFHGSNWHGSRLVGNGVPASLGYALAVSLRDSLKPYL